MNKIYYEIDNWYMIAVTLLRILFDLSCLKFRKFHTSGDQYLDFILGLFPVNF